MRLFVFALVLVTAETCYASNVYSVEEAWTYLTNVEKSEQWVVISSKKNDGFVQCARMDGYVRCEFPIWLKISPGPRFVSPKNSRGTPFPDMPGTNYKQYMSSQEVVILKKAVGDHGLLAQDTYSQVVDENGRLAGTAYDLRVVIDMKFSQFTNLVQAILHNVWHTTKQDGYAFETDS